MNYSTKPPGPVKRLFEAYAPTGSIAASVVQFTTWSGETSRPVFSCVGTLIQGHWDLPDELVLRNLNLVYNPNVGLRLKDLVELLHQTEEVAKRNFGVCGLLRYSDIRLGQTGRLFTRAGWPVLGYRFPHDTGAHLIRRGEEGKVFVSGHSLTKKLGSRSETLLNAAAAAGGRIYIEGDCISEGIFEGLSSSREIRMPPGFVGAEKDVNMGNLIQGKVLDPCWKDLILSKDGLYVKMGFLSESPPNPTSTSREVSKNTKTLRWL